MVNEDEPRHRRSKPRLSLSKVHLNPTTSTPVGIIIIIIITKNECHSNIIIDRLQGMVLCAVGFNVPLDTLSPAHWGQTRIRHCRLTSIVLLGPVRTQWRQSRKDVRHSGDKNYTLLPECSGLNRSFCSPSLDWCKNRSLTNHLAGTSKTNITTADVHLFMPAHRTGTHFLPFSEMTVVLSWLSNATLRCFSSLSISTRSVFAVLLQKRAA